MPAWTAPYFDLADPAFDVTSARGARRARRGLVRRDQLRLGGAALRRGRARCCRDRRFRQGNARWPAQNGIHSGPFSRLVAGGAAQPRGRRPRAAQAAADARRSGTATIAAMRPRFQALADELIDGFAARGRGGVRHRVRRAVRRPDPVPAARAARGPLARRSRTGPTTWASRSGSRVKEDLPRIEAALAGLHGYVDEVVADRSRAPARRPGHDPAPGAGGRRRADPPRARGVAGVPGLRRHGDHPQPARAWPCRPCCRTPTSGGCSPSGPSSAARRSRRSCGSTRRSPG